MEPYRYQKKKRNGEPYTCKFCHAVVMLDCIYSRYVNLDESLHKCERKSKFHKDRGYEAKQAARDKRASKL